MPISCYWIITLSYFLLIATQPGLGNLHSVRSFKIDYEGNQFLKDGKPFRYISGEMHYFRVPRIYWEDRLEKAKAMGLNTIQTYIAWNVHEQSPGKYDFDGEKDVFHFIKLAQQNGLNVILRPGPYIDAEWEQGGFPWWLAIDPTLVMRSTEDRRYMYYVKKWFEVLFSKLVPLLYRNGGPIISFQVENEYGNYYACDSKYLEELKDLFTAVLGDDVVLFTTDGYTDDYLTCGTIPSLYKTIDFGTEITAEKAFQQQRKYQKNGPLVNSEFYTGWLDYWGRPHQTRKPAVVAMYLDKILALNASVNLYMFEGGTNFGFMNGADRDENKTYLISPTSYDYDAPLSEAGDPTEKYFEIRKVIRKYVNHPLIPVPRATVKSAYGKVFMNSSVDLDRLIEKLYPDGAPINTSKQTSITMEKASVDYGFLLYRAHYPHRVARLTIDFVSDRTMIFIDGNRFAVTPGGQLDIDIPAGQVLDVFVENQGRYAYAPKGQFYLPDAKGIVNHVKINNEIVTDWQLFPLSKEALKHIASQPSKLIVELQTKPSSCSGNMFFFSSFIVNEATDTYIKPTNWTKGQIFINNLNIGRYWQSLGPQKTLFVPKNALINGVNTIFIMELDKAPCASVRECFVEFVDSPILN